jgi:hypothetical protein
MGFFGEADTLGCWLFDNRDSIRQLALRRITAFPDAKLPSPQKAEKKIKSNFCGFLDQLKPLISGEAVAKQPAPAKQELPQDAIYGDELKDLRNTAGKVRGLQNKLDKTTLKMQELGKNLNSTKAELLEQQAKNSELDKINSNLTKLLDQERRSRFIKISDGIQQRMRAEENRWMRELKEIESKFSVADNSDILDKAEAILQKQNQIDTIYGARIKLEKELEKFSQMQQRIHHARLDSLRPLNELGSIEEELERHCSELTEKLGKKHDFRVPQAFLQEVENAETLDDFSECRRRLQDAVKAEFVDIGVSEEIERYIHRREMTLYIKKLGPRNIIPAGLQGFEKLNS